MCGDLQGQHILQVAATMYINDHTKKVWLYCMKAKIEVFQHFTHFKNMVEKEIGMQIKFLRLDGGGDYFSNQSSKFLDD